MATQPLNTDEEKENIYMMQMFAHSLSIHELFFRVCFLGFFFSLFLSVAMQKEPKGSNLHLMVA